MMPLPWIIMEQAGINEIYTFDRHFERVPGNVVSRNR